MTAKKQQLPPPADGGLGDTLRRRLTRTDQSGTSGDTSRTSRTSATPRTDETRASGARSAPRASSATEAEATDAVRRSWYMPKAAADDLAAAVNDLHFETRRPKHEVLAVLIAVALEHRESARARLTD